MGLRKLKLGGKMNGGGGKIWFSHGNSQARGVAILVKRTSNFICHDVIRDKDGRYILVRGSVNQEKIIIVSVYAPNNNDEGFFESLFHDIDQTGVDRKIIASDFNTVVNCNID